MAQVGDRYIIEIGEVLKPGLYKVKGFNSLVFDETGLNKLEPYVEDCDLCGGLSYEDAAIEIQSWIDRDQVDPAKVPVLAKAVSALEKQSGEGWWPF